MALSVNETLESPLLNGVVYATEIREAEAERYLGSRGCKIEERNEVNKRILLLN